jgi:pyruvate/2-oxoglutarate/acetoin dehydrogenase E1 component
MSNISTGAAPEEVKQLRYIQAVQAALHWSLKNIPDAIYFGEDVAIPGGPFGATKGMYAEFGPSRIFDTPITEQAFIGMALGSAMTGLRPIAEIMYIDFAFVAMDQIVNQIATTRYASDGRSGAPLVIRTQQGYSPGSCSQHSHSAEAYFAHTPGLRVGLPSNSDDAYQMLRSAVVSDDPVIIIETRMLYPTQSSVRLNSVVEPIGGAKILRSGTDATVVCWGSTVTKSLAAAELMSAEGVNVEVIDLRWLSPLDMNTVYDSIARTGRLVITHEANLTGGFGGEISARVSEFAFSSLVAPIVRIATPDVNFPAAPSLQQVLLPNEISISNAIRKVIGYGRG